MTNSVGMVVVGLLLATCGDAQTGPADCERPSYGYPDVDGDGWGREGPGQAFCLAPGKTTIEVPPGLAMSYGDCDDADPRVWPTQAAWFATARPAGSWDYNCDGVEARELASANGACRIQVACMYLNPGAWLEGTGVPDCGQVGTQLLGCDGACQPVTGTRIQRCR